MAPFELALNRAGGYPAVMDCWDTLAQGSHRGRKAWRGGVREWCGRTSERSERGATVARAAVPRRAAPLPCESRPERSGGPAQRVGGLSKRGTMIDHSERRILSTRSGPMGGSAGTAVAVDAPLSQRLMGR